MQPLDVLNSPGTGKKVFPVRQNNVMVDPKKHYPNALNIGSYFPQKEGRNYDLNEQSDAKVV